MEDMEDKRGAAIRSDAARFQSVLLTDFDCITIPAAHSQTLDQGDTSGRSFASYLILAIDHVCKFRRFDPQFMRAAERERALEFIGV